MKIQKKQEIEFFGTKTGNANSIALGYATETKNFGEVAVGIMNKSTAAKDPNSPKGVCVDPDATLFSVGYGGSGERKNALEVKGDGSVMVSGKNGDINVADKIKQALDTDASIKLVRSAENNLQYTLMVNDEPRGSIDIPKDQFLKNVTYDSKGKQLVFTFVTLDEDEHVEKVPVGDLKDIYKAGDGITIDGDNVISADFSSVMTAISDEKTQRETTDNEIKSTLDTKADKTSIPAKLSDLKNDKVDITVNKSETSYSLKVDYEDNNVVRSTLGYKPNINNVGIAEFGLYSYDTAGNGLSQIRMRPENNKDDGQYIIQIQDVVGDKVNHASSLTTTDFQNINYEDNTAMIIGSDELEFYVNSNGFQKQLAVNKDGITKKDGKATEVFAADGSLFDVGKVVKEIRTNASAEKQVVDIGYTTTSDVTTYAVIPAVTSKKPGIMTSADKVKLDGIQDLIDAKANKDDVLQINHPSDYVDQVTFGNFHLICSKATNSTTLSFGEEYLTREDFAKINGLPSITGKLSNITAATTTEDMITKFNELLADLKAKGYMAADVTA